MMRTAVVFLALFAFVAQCHVLKDKDPVVKKPEHNREKRSCYVCEYGNGPPPPPPPGFGPPPPPPPYFRTQNWSGFSRGADGTPQGVYSGASAAANPQTSGQAYSLASSSAGAGNGGHTSGANIDQSTGYGAPSAGYGVQSAAKSQAQFGVGQNNVGYGNQKPFGSQDRGEDFGDQQVQSNGFGARHGGFGGSQTNSASSAQSYGSAFGNEQQIQSPDGGFENWHGHNHEKYQNGAALRDDNEQQVQSSGNGQWEHGGYGSGADFGSRQSGAASEASNGFGVHGGGSVGAGSGHEAFKGALDLASQGLQTSQQTRCSTCGPSNYALSNAKSDSSNAIALSVGR